MNMTLAHVSAASAAVLLVGSNPLADDLVHAPEPGAKVTRTVSEATSLSLKDAAVTIGGQDLPTDVLTLSATHARTVKVADVYGETVDGELRSLGRAFDAVSARIEVDAVTPEGKAESAKVEAEHPLTDLEVDFAWDEKEEAVTAEFAEGSDGDEELLEELRVSMDLASLLEATSEDDGERGPGSRWTVDPAVLAELASPGGVGFVPFEVEDDSQTLSLYLASLLSCRDLLREPTGEVEVLWKSTREIDGERCAVLDLDVDVKERRDLTERLRGSVLPALPTVTEELEIFEQVFADLALEGEGEVFWSLEQRRLRSVVLPMEMVVVFDATGVTEGQDLEVTLELEGETELRLATE